MPSNLASSRATPLLGTGLLSTTEPRSHSSLPFRIELPNAA
jgi:hypothetical protein